MRFPGVFATICSICILLRATTALPSAADFARGLSKRWFGVSGLWTNILTVVQPWPVKVDKAGIAVQQLRYCYSSQADYKTLHNIVQQAVKIYNPTIKENQKNGIAQSAWHKLKYARIGSKPNANGEVVDVAHADRVRMAHELGHALGLDHEFQRQDKDQYIKFNCQNLNDYQAIKNVIGKKDTSKGYKAGDTMKRLGFHGAIQYLKEKEGHIGQLQRSYKFDYASIMMYGSYDGSALASAADFPKGAVLEGIGKGKGAANFRVHMGGKEPRLVTAISEGDKARIAQLYPWRNHEGQLMGKFSGDWQGVPMKVGGPS